MPADAVRLLALRVDGGTVLDPTSTGRIPCRRVDRGLLGVLLLLEVAQVGGIAAAPAVRIRRGRGRDLDRRCLGDGEEGAERVDMTTTVLDAAVGVLVVAGAGAGVAAMIVDGAIRGAEDGITDDQADLC